MRGIRAFLVRLCGVFKKAGAERDFSREIESHLQLHTDDNIRAGMSPVEARREALLRLGGIEEREGESSRSKLPARRRNNPSGHSVRTAANRAQSWLYSRGCGHHGSGDRSQHSYFQRG